MKNKKIITNIFVQLSDSNEHIPISDLNKTEYEQFLSIVREIDNSYTLAINMELYNRKMNTNVNKNKDKNKNDDNK